MRDDDDKGQLWWCWLFIAINADDADEFQDSSFSFHLTLQNAITYSNR